MRRRLFSVASAVSLLSLTGCGLVWFPSIEKCPSPVQEVQVCDQLTGAAIPKSEVYWVAISREYRGYPSDEGQYRLPAYDPSLSDFSRYSDRFYGRRVADGRFQLDGKQFLAAWQWLWPLAWEGYGDFNYHGHVTQIYASAVGYGTDSILFAGGLDRHTFATHVSSDGVYEMGDKGVLKMFLRPNATTSPSSTSRSSQIGS